MVQASADAEQTTAIVQESAEVPTQVAPVRADSETLACLQLSSAEIEAGLVGLESDLAYVLEEAGVDRKWRGYIGSLGLLRLNAFAMLAPNEQQMQTF